MDERQLSPKGFLLLYIVPGAWNRVFGLLRCESTLGAFTKDVSADVTEAVAGSTTAGMSWRARTRRRLLLWSLLCASG